MNINLDSRILYILNILNEYGETYVVGGAIRDKLLGLEPLDYDLATNIHCKELMHILGEYNPIIKSEKYQIISFVFDGLEIEIARFRKESGILDGRNPKKIEFVDSIYDDLIRRDFTINAFAYNEQKGLIDLYNGLEDLKNKKINLIGDSLKRFKEDNQRIFRALYLVSRFNFDLSEEIYDAFSKIGRIHVINNNFNKLLKKILFDKYSYKSLEILYKWNLLKDFIPELTRKNLDEKDIDNIIYSYKIYCSYNMFEEESIGYAMFFMHSSKNILDSIDIAQKYLSKMQLNLNDLMMVKNLMYYCNIIFKNPSINMVNRMLYEFRSNKNVSKLMGLIGFLNYNKDYTDSIRKTIELLSKIQYIYFKGDVVFASDLDLTLVDIQNLSLNTYISNESLRKEVYNRVIESKIENNKEKIVRYLINKCEPDLELKKDYSSGAVVYRYNKGKLEFILVKVANGNWGFPKGHIEEGENSYQAAIREVKEETNLDIEIIDKDKFKKEISYVVGKGNLKYLKLYLAKTITNEVKIDDKEISEYRWCDYKEALKTITYTSQRNVLQKARFYLFKRKD